MMYMHHRSRIHMLGWMFASLLLFPVPAYSEVIQGFRDLKFGMTERDVQALEHCNTSSECLYELAGKNRYLQPFYAKHTPNGQSPPTLAKISIEMGRFTNEWYEELQIRLLDQYQATYDLTDRDIAAFQNEQQSELTSVYENGHVLLKVVRRKFGNLILEVVYQNADLAKEALQDHKPQPKAALQ
ncbi:MAG: hypothetical protein NPIRA04_00910 [Nitrospirales bacterium]|nr:MAG: hypothetical protein NPIRA04_00910 [Nitrospirales bacterium]